MSLLKIAWRYVWSRALVTVLTILGVALGVALISITLTLRRETEQAFLRETELYDLVVGAKGSPLQLVLSSVYHMDVPTGNIPFGRFEQLKNDYRVREAYPIGLGDNYNGFRIIGTTRSFFDLSTRSADGTEESAVMEFASGERFTEAFDAVLGSSVAADSGFVLGDTFVGSHGLTDTSGLSEHKEFPYTVVGILEPTGTAIDRGIYVPIEAVWIVHDKEKKLHEDLGRQLIGLEAEDEDEEEDSEGPGWGFFASFAEDSDDKASAEIAMDDGKEVTAVLLQLESVGMRLWMTDEINTETESMAAIPVNEMLRLYQRLLTPLQKTFLGIAFVVVFVSALSIFATLFQAAERRRRDIAILRTLGAKRFEIFVIVFLEALFVSIIGIGIGFLLGHGGLAAAAESIRVSSGLAINGWSIDNAELLALGFVLLAGMLAGICPALFAYSRQPSADL